MSAAGMLTQALPTLLTSRRRAACTVADLEKRQDRAQSTQAPVKDGAAREGARPAGGLPEAYAMPVRVRNTFIDTAAERSPSLERFYREREVSTCPSAHVGRFSRADLFQEADESGPGGDGGAAVARPRAGALEAASAHGAATPGAEQLGPSNILSLAEALGLPATPLQVPEWGKSAALLAPAAAVPQAPRGGAFGGSYFSWGDDELLPAEGAPTGGFFVQVPCDGSPGGWRSPWCAAPPHRGAASDARFIEGGPAGARAPAGFAGGAVAACAAPPVAASAGAQGVQLPVSHPVPGSDALPSAGSAAHALRGCKPCAFFHTVGCENGPACQFCHLCGPEERRLRRKAKMEARRADRLRRASRRGALAEPRDLEEDLDARSAEEGTM